ncbi:MAG: PAS domain-containing protein [Planktotalea sp.]|uniref:PAS domain-containing protein n=1 Tax=Planktotalea sp. TaxID=2029877 RepID=UPI003C77EFE9
MSHDSPILPIRSAHTNIVTLDHSAFSDAPDRFPACRDLLAYWEALRGSRQMPARAEFDPRGIEQTLACSFVGEKVAPSVVRIRVAGSVMSEALGMDVRGMPITAFFDPASRDVLAEATRDLLGSPAMVTIDLSARRRFSLSPIRARMLLLPMSDASGQVTRLVGCLDIEGGLDKTPRRFQITSLSRKEISGDAPTPSAPFVPLAPKTEPSYAFAEAPHSFRSKRAAKSTSSIKNNSLRLVVNNEKA